MKKKIKIGIPKAFLYYRHYIFWKSFFEMLGCKVIFSPETNRDIVQKGKDFAVDESCLPFKIYLGHVQYLVDKCDYILVPRIDNYGKGKRVCMKFNGIYDVINNLFPSALILDYNIDHLKGKYEFIQFIRIGLKVNKNIFKVIHAYFISKRREKNYNNSLINEQAKTLKSKNLKVLIVSHPYIIYDSYLGSSVIDYLKSMNVDVLYSDRMDRRKAIGYAKGFSKTLYWLYSKENIGSIFYYKNAIDGIIFISSFPCGPDSLVNELAIRKNSNTPMINIILDESTAETGLQTRLESFIDIIKARQENE